MLKLLSAACVLLMTSVTVASDLEDRPISSWSWPQPTRPSLKTVVIDCSEPLPQKIVIAVGDTLVFANGPVATFKVEPTDNKGILLFGRPHNAYDQRAVYRAVREGKGQITITYNVQAPGHKPMKPVTIPVEVKK